MRTERKVSIPVTIIRLLLALCLLCGAAVAQVVVKKPNLDVEYFPTPQRAVDKMLELAGVKGEDYC